jgi:hypothetical protein
MGLPFVGKLSSSHSRYVNQGLFIISEAQKNAGERESITIEKSDL